MHQKLFLGQYKNSNAESLINLLLNSHNCQFSLYILDQIEELIMIKEDFYQKEENQRYKLFNLLSEKCYDFFKNPELSKGKYLKGISLVKHELMDEIIQRDISYELIINLINEESFFKKVETIFYNENLDVKYIFDRLKNDVEICTKKFKDIESVKEYLNCYFNDNTKKKKIKLINEILLKYKKKKISEIVIINHFFDDIKDFDFKKLTKELKKIKSKEPNEGKQKKEGQIFKDSIGDNKEVKKEIKLDLDEINNLKNELNKANKIIEQQNLTINDLQNKLNNYNNIINNYQTILSQKDSELNNIKLQLNNIKQNNNNDSNNLPYKVYFNDILVVNFISSDQNIHYAVSCLKNNTFAEIEEKLYRQYPQYRETNNNFIANGKLVLRFKTIAENKIGSGLPVTLIVPA